MPPAGKAFAVTQTHWFRTRDGMITEHWANRDDLAMARQAGWVPPSPRFPLRAAPAKRRAQKHTARQAPTLFRQVVASMWPAGPGHQANEALPRSAHRAAGDSRARRVASTIKSPRRQGRCRIAAAPFVRPTLERPGVSDPLILWPFDENSQPAGLTPGSVQPALPHYFGLVSGGADDRGPRPVPSGASFRLADSQPARHKHSDAVYRAKPPRAAAIPGRHRKVSISETAGLSGYCPNQTLNCSSPRAGVNGSPTGPP